MTLIVVGLVFLFGAESIAIHHAHKHPDPPSCHSVGPDTPEVRCDKGAEQ